MPGMVSKKDVKKECRWGQGTTFCVVWRKQCAFFLLLFFVLLSSSLVSLSSSSSSSINK
jgi:hypothetical protein